MNLFLRPYLEQEIREAARWYEDRQPGLGDRFLLAIDDAISRVEARPESYQVVHLDIRRAPVHRFPYSVFYFLPGDRIEVIAVVHDARHPGVWQGRREG